MASGKPTLAVILSPKLLKDLKGIYDYNADHRGPSQAGRYEDFLLTHIANLATGYDAGKNVDGFPKLKSLTLKAGRKGDGHIVIYEIDEVARTVNVHHLYHTKMDLPERLSDEFQ